MSHGTSISIISVQLEFPKRKGKTKKIFFGSGHEAQLVRVWF